MLSFSYSYCASENLPNRLKSSVLGHDFKHLPNDFVRLRTKGDFSAGYALLEFFRTYWETTFNPTIEAIKVEIKNTLQKSAGSLKIKIPTKTVPTAPIPVQTA